MRLDPALTVGTIDELLTLKYCTILIVWSPAGLLLEMARITADDETAGPPRWGIKGDLLD
jgi:hypothetical protein